MKTEKNINVEFLRVEGDGAPFVKVDYVDKDAQEHTGLMLLDSGSNDNILSREMAYRIGDLCKMEETTDIITVTNDVIKANNVKFSFALGGTQFHETFNISQEAIPCSVEGFSVIGILGVSFMQRHRLVIDYSDFSFHTSCISPANLAISDCDFFFPMMMGLKMYGIPVLALRQNGEDIAVLADTGANGNVIAKPTITNHGVNCQYLKETSTIKSLNGSLEVEDAMVRFNLLTLKEKGVAEVSFHDDFQVIPHYLLYDPSICDDNGKPMPPAEGLIGSPFMAREGWVLDFAQKVIYKCKS